ncbi:hypothetical protein INT43_001411 [Umbelopsis isabellina]|uniref:alpha-galactosidase n=1 Tax=Mortierella isabellina TaxID=91625 RepID=A0A8H7U7Q2_MORIS|nr:hypothetical protein INT43_001411 [Umbelopsis isabellina]
MRFYYRNCLIANALALVVNASPVKRDNGLTVLKTTTTPDGFHSAATGWNSFGLQANNAVNPNWKYDQDHVIQQCDVLADTLHMDGGYCSLDSGWSTNNGDDYARLLYDTTIFDLPTLASHLHSKSLNLGVYVLPGAFCTDGNKTIYGTNIKLNSTFSGNNDGFLRCDFDFQKPGVQEWHNSVVNLFAQWGVDLIKLDFVTPGSPDNGGNLPANNSGSVIAYHNAIKQASRPMRLDISWKLERNNTFYDIWKANADTMRTDQDINNSGNTTFVAWEKVQRAIDNYRQYIVLQIPKNLPLSIYPDMDNMYVGNKQNLTGVTDAQRQTIATHWIGAAANRITGSDLTQLDSYGTELLTSPQALSAANFTAQYPMQPRNPGSGSTSAQQLQAWVAGPDSTGVALAVLANYGPDQGQGGFNTSLSGKQTVSISMQDLGLKVGTYQVQDIWQNISMGSKNSSLSTVLDEGESVFYRLSPA